jgi:histidinol-phosphate phosphatase family protein
MKQVVILAGGQGTRLRERLNGRPKPLVDVCGVPLLERQLELVKRQGFTDVLILVNHAADQIEAFCASRRNWGLNVRCIDDGEPRGTAGATLAVYSQLADEFLVMYGDTMLDVDLGRFHAFHQAAPETVATLFLHPNDHPHDSDLVETDDHDRVLAFHPYPHDTSRYYPNRVNAALYWIRRQALKPWRDTAGPLDFGRDLFPQMLKTGLVLRGYTSPEYIKDLGTPARLDRVCADIRSGKIEGSSLARRQAIVFLDRDGTLNREEDHLAHADQLELLPGATDAIRRLNESAYRCCVVTNQPVVARGECTEAELRNIHNKLETLLGHGGAYLDRIYVCPHHPDRGFEGERPELKIDCTCRKPNTGMLEQALRDFNGDAGRSWYIGDTSVDVETARRAGVRSILVETGYAGLDYRFWAQPDYTAPNLAAAVDFILSGHPLLIEQCTELASEIPAGALVLVGGQSRSGKSTFAAGLREALHHQGKRAVTLSADRWLRSAQERGSGVLARYDMDRLQALVRTLEAPCRRPRALPAPGYHKLHRVRHENVDTVELSPEHVVVVEGTIALALKTQAAAVYRYHVAVDESVRQTRMLREYRVRGLDEAAALALYQSRADDEFPVLEALAARGTRVELAAAKA